MTAISDALLGCVGNLWQAVYGSQATKLQHVTPWHSYVTDGVTALLADRYQRHSASRDVTVPATPTAASSRRWLVVQCLVAARAPTTCQWWHHTSTRSCSSLGTTARSGQSADARQHDRVLRLNKISLLEVHQRFRCRFSLYQQGTLTQ